jgi:hypothetical protein
MRATYSSCASLIISIFGSGGTCTRLTADFRLRGEYFNVFNTPQFYPPANSLGNPDFATLTAVRGGSNRQGQVALKFIF